MEQLQNARTYLPGKKIAQRDCGTNGIDSGNMTLLLTVPSSQKLKDIKWNKDVLAFKLQKGRVVSCSVLFHSDSLAVVNARALNELIQDLDKAVEVWSVMGC